MKFAAPLFLYALPVVWLVLGVWLWLARRRRHVLFQQFAGPENPASDHLDSGPANC